jgi:hypothetical protein
VPKARAPWARALEASKKSAELACAEFGVFVHGTCWSRIDLRRKK